MDDGVMIPNPKKIVLDIEGRERYSAALATSGLDPRRHECLKNEIKNKLVTEKIDILPRNLIDLCT